MAELAVEGTCDDIVLEAQKLLNKAAMQCRVDESGDFDKKFTKALKEYQGECGVKQTGKLDDKTFKLLKEGATGPKYDKQITYSGKTYLLTNKQYDQLVQKTLDQFKPALRDMKRATYDARSLWDHHKALNDEQYIVGWMVEAWSGADLPKESIVKAAEKAVEAAQKAYDSKDLANLPKLIQRGAKPINKARNEVGKYVKDIQSGGDSLIGTLEFVKTTSFIVVAVIAAPVAASYGAGAVAAGVIAGAGTNAVETLATEVGKGLAGTSKGIGDATMNVLKDAFIGGTIGALVKGKGAEKLLAKIGPMVAKKLAGGAFAKVSEKALAKFVIAYFKKNGANILEGIAKDVVNSAKSTTKPLTFKSFCESVVKNVMTAGLFKKFEDAAKFDATAFVGQLSSKQKAEIFKGFGKKVKPADMIAVFTELGKNEKEIGFNKALDIVFGALKGNESADKVKKDVIKKTMTPKLIAKAKAIADAKAK